MTTMWGRMIFFQGGVLLFTTKKTDKLVLFTAKYLFYDWITEHHDLRFLASPRGNSAAVSTKALGLKPKSRAASE